MRRYAAQGFTQIKVYSQLDHGLLAALGRAAGDQDHAGGHFERNREREDDRADLLQRNSAQRRIAIWIESRRKALDRYLRAFEAGTLSEAQYESRLSAHLSSRAQSLASR